MKNLNILENFLNTSEFEGIESISLINETENNNFVLGTLFGKPFENSTHYRIAYEYFLPNYIKNEFCFKLGFDYLHSVTFVAKEIKEDDFVLKLRNNSEFKLCVSLFLFF